MDLGKFTKDGKFLMLALDHRQSFKKLMNPDSPDSVSDQEVVELKSDIIDSLKDQFSGLLIDETYGLEAYPNHTKPFLLPVEKTGYTDEDGERITELEYTVPQLLSWGAFGAKLLLYFNPHLESARKQMETARKVLEDCKAHDFLMFLEIVTYETKREGVNLIHLEGVYSKAGLIIESLRSFYEVDLIPDVWKLEYPGSVDACEEITKMVVKTPWILLTGGSSFKEFKKELEVAAEAGAGGFLAGRALWQEVCQMEGEKRQNFLKKTLPERFQLLSEVVRKV